MDAKVSAITDSRITQRFAKLKAANRSGFIAFITANDPTPDVFRDIFHSLPACGVDVIEIGMPFSDPMADGPAIQASSQRALTFNTSLADVFAAVRAFRKTDSDTPIVLMGYYNPIYRMGPAAFAEVAADAGADGVIVVDLPPEEADELNVHLKTSGLHFIFLTAPTSSDARLPAIVARASGFLYHVAVAGITGTKEAEVGAVKTAVARLRRHSSLPVAVGFGIKTPDAARAIAAQCDAAVVGSAIVDIVAKNVNDAGQPQPGLADEVRTFVKSLADAVHSARS